jgi:hypothetical protein
VNKMHTAGVDERSGIRKNMLYLMEQEADGGMVTVSMYIQVITGGCICSSGEFRRYEGGGED